MSFLFAMLARSRGSRSKTGIGDGLQTLDAAYRKQTAALARARAGVSELLAAETRLEAEARTLAAAAENEPAIAEQRARVLECAAELRRARLMLESSLEKVRMRVELFRTEKLAAGVRYVAAQALTRSGMSVAGLTAEMRDVETLTERARERSQAALRALSSPGPESDDASA